MYIKKGDLIEFRVECIGIKQGMAIKDMYCGNATVSDTDGGIRYVNEIDVIKVKGNIFDMFGVEHEN